MNPSWIMLIQFVNQTFQGGADNSTFTVADKIKMIRLEIFCFIKNFILSEKIGQHIKKILEIS